jgi:hypothetical protein
MSQKHFRALADGFRSTRPVNALQMVNNQWNRDVQMVVSICKMDNDRFDGERFINACGGYF